MDNRRVKFCLKISAVSEKLSENLRGVKFFGAPCSSRKCNAQMILSWNFKSFVGLDH